jgi:hypothetical protein
MKTFLPSLLSTRCQRLAAAAPGALAALLLLLGKSTGAAENPWTTPLPAWGSSFSGSSFSGSHWSSWENTTGGTFSDPFSSSHLSHAAPLRAIRNPEIDPAMLKAGSIAEHRAHPHSTSFCWRYVKEALVAAGGVSSYPQTAYAKDAGRDLVENYGFVQLSVRSPERAPVGSVLVYGGPGAGHVELRTATGFVSDFYHRIPANLPFIGAFTRLDRHHKDIQTAQVGGTGQIGS